jgi:hypothetical protein
MSCHDAKQNKHTTNQTDKQPNQTKNSNETKTTTNHKPEGRVIS